MESCFKGATASGRIALKNLANDTLNKSEVDRLKPVEYRVQHAVACRNPQNTQPGREITRMTKVYGFRISYLVTAY